jgi:S1-C subfamily serine protease
VSTLQVSVSRETVAAVVVVAVFAGAIAGGLAGGALGDNSGPAATTTVTSAPPTRPSSALSRSPEAIYQSDSAGVVVITDQQSQAVQATPVSPGGKQTVEALGSGFVVDARGDIVTNDHVVQGATKIRVSFTGDASYPAEVVGTDPSSDLAVIRVNAPPAMLHPLSFGDSSSVEVGDSVYAIGNPFGLQRTMTAGIVSATGRDIRAPNGLTIPNAIQTDAAINHGNSGGPLLDSLGRVIGVNSQIEGGTVDGNVGVGFAIPSSTVRSVADQLIANGRAQHPFLGVQIRTIDPTVQKLQPGLPRRGALVVSVVKGGPAANAGIEPVRARAGGNGAPVLVGGDAIVAVDGKTVETSAQLSEIVAAHKPGDTLRVEIVRHGVRRTVAVRLGDAPT